MESRADPGRFERRGGGGGCCRSWCTRDRDRRRRIDPAAGGAYRSGRPQALARRGGARRGLPPSCLTSRSRPDRPLRGRHHCRHGDHRRSVRHRAIIARTCSTPRCRVLFAPTFGNAPVDPEIAASVAAAAAELDRQGHLMTQVAHFDVAEPIGDIWPVISQTGVAWLLSRSRRLERKIGSGPSLPWPKREPSSRRPSYLGALDAVAKLRRDVQDLFARYDLILTPTTAALPWPATESHPSTIAGQPVGPRGHAIFTPLANAAGLPAISLPCAPSASGLPIGFQLIGGPDQDALVLSVSHEYESTVGLRVRWPEIE